MESGKNKWGIFFLNTASEQSEIAYFTKNSTIFYEKFLSNGKHSEKLLPLIDECFKKNKLKFKSIGSVVVISGPGHFTALRVGIAFANAISFALNIPIHSLKLDEYEKLKRLKGKDFYKFFPKKRDKVVVPFYDREPNISRECQGVPGCANFVISNK